MIPQVLAEQTFSFRVDGFDMVVGDFVLEDNRLKAQMGFAKDVIRHQDGLEINGFPVFADVYPDGNGGAAWQVLSCDLHEDVFEVQDFLYNEQARERVYQVLLSDSRFDGLDDNGIDALIDRFLMATEEHICQACSVVEQQLCRMTGYTDWQNFLDVQNAAKLTV